MRVKDSQCLEADFAFPAEVGNAIAITEVDVINVVSQGRGRDKRTAAVYT